jgi:hypothetical protein
MISHMAEYDLGCLKTNRPPFFERLGWQRWRGPRAGRKPDGTLTFTPDQPDIMILRLANTPPLDLDRMLTIEVQAGRIW